MKREKYSIIRLIISMAFGILFLLTIYHIIADYFVLNSESGSTFSGGPYKSKFLIYKEYFEGTLFLIAPILFALNRKLTDYVSFMMFIILFGGIFSVGIVDCSQALGFNSCMKQMFSSKDSLLLLIVFSPLIYLTIDLIRNIGKK